MKIGCLSHWIREILFYNYSFPSICQNTTGSSFSGCHSGQTTLWWGRSGRPHRQLSQHVHTTLPALYLYIFLSICKELIPEPPPDIKIYKRGWAFGIVGKAPFEIPVHWSAWFKPILIQLPANVHSGRQKVRIQVFEFLPHKCVSSVPCALLPLAVVNIWGMNKRIRDHLSVSLILYIQINKSKLF